MVYIDSTLCSGCGLCLDACERRAISIQGKSAVIDQALCVDCGRCAAICMTGAIRSVSIVLDGPSSLTRPNRRCPQCGRGGFPPSTVRPLETVERLVSGVCGLLTFVLDVQRPAGLRWQRPLRGLSRFRPVAARDGSPGARGYGSKKPVPNRLVSKASGLEGATHEACRHVHRS